MKNFHLTEIFTSRIMFATRSAAFRAAMFIIVGGLIVAVPGWAQSDSGSAAAPAPASASATATIHGHAQDPLYLPVPNAKIVITTDGKTALYTFKTDANGDYTGSGIKPGTYSVELVGPVQDKTGKTSPGIMDYQKNITFTAGKDTQVDFDMSRADYVSKLPEDVQKKIAETRKENASAQQENKKITNVNKLIQDARAARKAGDFDKAITLDIQATQGKPDVGLTWFELGDSYLGAKKYDDAATNYKKALTVMETQKGAHPEILAAANNNLGEALAKSGKTQDAVAAYEAAAKADPSQAGKYYANEAIVLFKTGQADPAATAADKAIAADPTKPIPYYIKGWALVQHATIDPKTNKIKLPPGTADAYNKFLEMEPTGPLADDARNILQQSGETVHSAYKKH